VPAAPERTDRSSDSVAEAPELALFPLATVLLPGGLLPLRIFEPRYVALISRCLRQDEAFGVILIRSGTETASAVEVAEVGTSARIVDFQRLPEGLLGVLCRGERRFRILARRRQADGLNCARVSWLPESAATPPAPQFAALVAALRETLDGLVHSQRWLEPHYEDAGWISYRLAESLTLEPQELQRLLELDDPAERLQRLARLLPKDPR